MRRKRVLLLWYEADHRPELLKPFIDMSDELEFIQLNYKNKEERTTSSSPFPMIYWHDYKNAQAVLNDVDPSVIIGVSENIFSAALINAAKKTDIPFFGLQHGYTHESISTIIVDTRKFSMGLVISYIKSSAFFFRSFSVFRFRKFCSAVYFYWLYPRVMIQKILTEHKFPWLTPDYFICFSPYSSRHHKEMYRLRDDQIKLIGILWFDKLFQNFTRLKKMEIRPNEKYYLLIDTCFDNYPMPISGKQIDRCYKTLSDFCEHQGAKLFIKLHPWNYTRIGLLQHANIEYIRNIDDDSLHLIIAGSEGCFGFYSTLILPVLAFKPVVQIRYGAMYLELAEEKGLTPVLDFYTFTEQDIHFPEKGTAELHKKDLDYLIYKTDGRATERLKKILLTA